MSDQPLYPLSFEPIHQYRLWGGRRLRDWLRAAPPGDGPIGEAWLLSDRDDYPSRVAEGPLKGRTIAQLTSETPELLLGTLARRFRRFPLLLKFLDVQKMLSVQVHPRDSQLALIPAGETGKSEAWVVLEARPEGRIYAGVKPGTTPANLRVLSEKTVDDRLASFAPRRGQCVLIEAGTVHSVGNGVVLFEVQENSDVTFRLYDWDHIDSITGRKRELQVEQALACVDFDAPVIGPVTPVVQATNPVRHELLLQCPHFCLWRLEGAAPFMVGAAGDMRVIVCLNGSGHIEYDGSDFGIERGVVILMPAIVGACRLRPRSSVEILEISVPGQT